MGQTLTHGVYLPDEGERNCYSGLAANWQILDGAVGTIAEHTSALSGKAPLVHTHTKADITDFPAYGTTAGTICEGNDARLSDARTPVAHTHTKSDVTDLFNSANTWTGDNTFTKFVKNAPAGLDISENPSSNIDTGFRIVDKDNNIISNLQYTKGTSGNSQIALNIRTKDSNNVVVNRSVCLNIDQYGTWCDFKPSVNNTISLGSSSYQWKSVYAQNYYYNGTAWGLDKENVWSANQTILKDSESLSILKRSNLKLGDAIPQTTQVLGTIAFAGSDSVNAGLVTFRDNSNGDTSLIILARQKYNSNGDRDPGGYQYETRMDIGIDSSRNRYIRPASNGQINLGTSTNKWKSFNGTNPGALSLPDKSGADPIDFSQWDVSGAAWTNYYTPSENGWLRITINDRATNSIYVVNSDDISSSAYGNGSQITGGTGRLVLFMPVRSGVTYQIIIKANSISDVGKAEFIPCNGNV